jgi:type I restriction enzyme, R subunit
MHSNFRFLKHQWPDLCQRSAKAEQLVISDPRTSLVYARMALELAVNWMYENDHDLELPYDNSLNSLLKQPEFQDQFSHRMYADIDVIRKVGNIAIHNRPVSSTDSEKIITNLFYFSKWFAKSYADEEPEEIGPFDYLLIPKEGEETLSKRQLQELQKQFDQERTKIHDALKRAIEKNNELLETNELYVKRIATLQAEQEKRKERAGHDDEVKHPRNEYETRKYIIDIALREAGWDLQGVNDKEFKVEFMPKSTNRTETGFVDYVLWNDDGKPLAVVEAKRTMEAVTKGENQAQLYADCIEKMYGQRPVMFYTNGFETFLWDDRFYKRSRPVSGFYSKQELQTIFFRREHRKDIRKEPIDTLIAGRSYQMRSIKSIAEHFAGNDKSTGKLIGTNRGALLVLATGTGKTRVSIAFSKLLLESNWAKRILFLADRVSLVNQAQRNYTKFLPEHSNVNLLADKENAGTRLVFSTYQTMMGQIDSLKDGDERFYGVGHFDLLIFDEAHRSIYRKYRAIFQYFDALFLGLTATPKDSIDKNTYAVFGLPDKNPTDAYTFQEAVSNNHLVGYRTIEVPTKFQTEGIKYKDLSPEEQEEFEKEILEGEQATGNEWVDKNALNAWLFNKDTTTKTLHYIFQHCIRKRGGDEPGKTIIFARNRRHAEFLKDRLLDIDKELYGNEYAKVITFNEPKAEEFIRRFCDEEKERLPQIAISVDMLDTGIDAPSVVNLVFYKPVKSYTKFWQMIGRGSRLRPDLFGPGKDKERFLIFDLCGNFNFFDENQEGVETSVQKGLSEIIFNLKLELAQHLKEKAFQKREELVRYRTRLLDELHEEIAGLDMDRFDVKMKLKWVMQYGKGNRELWNHLEKKDVQHIEEELAILVKPRKNDSDMARFYDKLLYTLIMKRLETPHPEEFVAKFIVPVTKVATLSKRLLMKTSIPEISYHEELIKQPLDEGFWKLDGISHLEKIRANLRELIKYIDREDQRIATTDFVDDLDEAKVVSKDFMGERATGYESPFTNNVHRLEEIVRENQNNVTIGRIRQGEAITREELRSLETLLLKGKLQKEELEKEMKGELDLVRFIIDLMGLSSAHVDQAFADFVNDYQLSAVQVEFLETIKQFLTRNGRIDPVKLYESPFKNFHNLGVSGVFSNEQADKIFRIIERVNGESRGA